MDEFIRKATLVPGNLMIKYHALSLTVLACSVSTVLSQSLVPGDLVVGSREYGSLYGPIRASTGPYPLLSGPDLGQIAAPVRGGGPQLLVPSTLSMVALKGGRLVVRAGATADSRPFLVDPGSGDRTPLAGTDGPLWADSGDMIAESDDTMLAIASDWDSLLLGNGKLLRYRLSTAETTIVSGGTRGDGLVMHRPRTLTQMDANTVAAVEFGPTGGMGSRGGINVYRVDLATGNRELISTLGVSLGQRRTCTGGIVSGAASPVPLRGQGPRFDLQVRSLAFVGGRLFAGGASEALDRDPPYASGIIEVDLATGDRTLLGGAALLDGNRVEVPFGPGSTSFIFDAPTAMQPLTDHSVIMTATFGPDFVWEFDINTRVLSIIADIGSQIHPNFSATTRLSGLALVPPVFCWADFNVDGDVGTDADIEAFFRCLAGDCCLTCGTSDFNNDGDFGTDADIESFFRVLAGGVC